MRASTLCYFNSRTGNLSLPNLSEGADSVGGQPRGHTACPSVAKQLWQRVEEGAGGAGGSVRPVRAPRGARTYSVPVSGEATVAEGGGRSWRRWWECAAGEGAPRSAASEDADEVVAGQNLLLHLVRGRGGVGLHGQQGAQEGQQRAHDAQEERPACPCLLYTSPSPRDMYKSRMPSSA